MSENKVNEQALVRARDLLEKRREIFSLPPETAMERLLSERHPAAVIHSFPEEDFYFLIHDIGVEDAGELISLASLRQWEFILDSEIWDGDRIDPSAMTGWFNHLMEADPDRLVRWAAEENSEFFEYYLFKNIEVAIREHDQDPSELGEGFLTEDDVFYVRITESSFSSESGIEKEMRPSFLWKFIKGLSDYDHARFQEMLLESRQVIPAESEEEMFRLRNVRRAEKGFLPFDEAIGIYQPIDPSSLESPAKQRSLFRKDGSPGYPVPLYAAGMVERDNLFVRALETLERVEDIEGLQSEFAGLCNRVISADQRRIREREELRDIVRKVCGYVSIGLETLVPADRRMDLTEAVGAIRRYPLNRIFRVGYGRALDLKWRAQRWRAESWFEERGLPLGFWGEEWLGVLGGLLIKRPLFYDNYRTVDQLYREFHSVEDIRATERVFEDVRAMDRLLSLIRVPVDPIPGKHLTWKNVLLTLWARHRVELSEILSPIAFPEFRRFYEDIWTDGREAFRSIRDDVKSDFLNWLADATRLQTDEISARFRSVLEELFAEIEDEYRDVGGKDLDPRFVRFFLLS